MWHIHTCRVYPWPTPLKGLDYWYVLTITHTFTHMYMYWDGPVYMDDFLWINNRCRWCGANVETGIITSNEREIVIILYGVVAKQPVFGKMFVRNWLSLAKNYLFRTIIYLELLLI